MMDFKPNGPQDFTPGRPRGAMPPRPRGLMDDFGPRRPATPGMLPRRPGQSQTRTNPAPQPASTPAPTQSQAPAPLAARPAHLMTEFSPARSHAQPRPQPRQTTMPAPPQPEDIAANEPKQRDTTGHAGLVGLAVFVVLGALLLSPLIPGTIMNLPGSSNSSSSGDQSLACAHDLSNTSSTTTYNTKLGSPLVYKSAATTMLRGTCDGRSQTAVGGRTAQFNPLAGLVDLAAAAVVATVVSIIWRKIFGAKN